MRLRSAFLALALAAMAAVVLKPVCDEIAAALFPDMASAQHFSSSAPTGAGDVDSELCCDSIQVSALPETAASLVISGGMLLGLALLGYRLAVRPLPTLAVRSGTLPSKSFHVRSARVLR